MRGPRGGYELAREQRRITADDILRAAGTVDDRTTRRSDDSALLGKVVMPALAHAEAGFLGRARAHQYRGTGALGRRLAQIDDA